MMSTETDKEALERQHALGEAFAAYIMGGAAYQYGLKMYDAFKRNPGHPEEQVVLAALHSFMVAQHRANRWLKRAMERSQGEEPVSDDVWRRWTVILQDINRRYMGLSSN